MTWGEFRLRSKSFFRCQKREWEKVRDITYYTMLASGAFGKTKVSKEQFMPIYGNTKTSRMTDSMKEAMRIANEQAEKERQQLKDLNNGKRLTS